MARAVSRAAEAVARDAAGSIRGSAPAVALGGAGSAAMRTLRESAREPLSWKGHEAAWRPRQATHPGARRARAVEGCAAVLLATRAREVAPAAADDDQGRGAALEPLARRVSLKGEPAEAGSLWSIEATRTPLSMSTVLPLLARRTLTL